MTEDNEDLKPSDPPDRSWIQDKSWSRAELDLDQDQNQDPLWSDLDYESHAGTHRHRLLLEMLRGTSLKLQSSCSHARWLRFTKLVWSPGLVSTAEPGTEATAIAAMAAIATMAAMATRRHML